MNKQEFDDLRQQRIIAGYELCAYLQGLIHNRRALREILLETYNKQVTPDGYANGILLNYSELVSKTYAEYFDELWDENEYRDKYNKIDELYQKEKEKQNLKTAWKKIQAEEGKTNNE